MDQLVFLQVFQPLKVYLFAIAAIVFLGAAVCRVPAQRNVGNSLKDAQQETGLKDYFKDYFPIGVAVGTTDLRGESAKLILKEFNSITAENDMKMGSVHPREDHYNWGPSDSIVSFAQLHGLSVRGHNLLWHRQAPYWFFTKNGAPVSKDLLLQRLKDHITTVVNRYKGKIYAWDVVNEAIDDDSTRFLRNDRFYNLGGEEIIAKAFQYAHEADPTALLFYNDYSTETKQKRDRIYILLKRLLDAGVPVHGIGLQAHWSLYHPDEKSLKEAIEKYASLGLKVQVTEMDVSIYPPAGSRTRSAADTLTLTREIEEKQAEKYRKMFRVFAAYKGIITGVTFWNVSDRYTWLSNEPVRGRKNYPLLFDTCLQPKQAYWEVIKIGQQ